MREKRITFLRRTETSQANMGKERIMLHPFRAFPKASDREAWGRVASCEAKRALVSDILAYAEGALASPIAFFQFSRQARTSEMRALGSPQVARAVIRIPSAIAGAKRCRRRRVKLPLTSATFCQLPPTRISTS